MCVCVCVCARARACVRVCMLMLLHIGRINVELSSLVSRLSNRNHFEDFNTLMDRRKEGEMEVAKESEI